MIEAIVTNIYPILGAVLLAVLVGYIAWRNNYKIRRANACNYFRTEVRTALKGIYPPTKRWDANINQALIATLPAVKSACVGFMPYVSRFRRKAFTDAYVAYEDQCHQEDPFGQLVVYSIAPDEFDGNPQTVLCQHVEHLLGFANET